MCDFSTMYGGAITSLSQSLINDPGATITSAGGSSVTLGRLTWTGGAIGGDGPVFITSGATFAPGTVVGKILSDPFLDVEG